MTMEYKDFIKHIYDITQIDLNSYKEKQMHRRIDSLISKNGINNYDDYISLLRSDISKLSEFLNHITINVSEFYRNPEQWEIFEHEILPGILAKTKNPYIWSAACSTGDEPYTIAMIISKYIPVGTFKVIATDIDKQILEKAKTGSYTPKSLEGLPSLYREKHFIQYPDKLVIKDDIKSCVEFKNHNLLRDQYPSNLDLIVCRNVLIYFTEEAKDNIYIKFNKSLKLGAKLFIGSTEQILFSQKFNFKAIKTFFYEKEKDII